MAKLSVIVPAYNAETTLRTAVESILSQQVPGLQVLQLLPVLEQQRPGQEQQVPQRLEP